MDRNLQAIRTPIRFASEEALGSGYKPPFECFKKKIKKKPAANTIRARILMLSDRLRMEKREGKKRPAEKYEPIKATSPALITRRS